MKFDASTKTGRESFIDFQITKLRDHIRELKRQIGRLDHHIMATGFDLHCAILMRKTHLQVSKLMEEAIKCSIVEDANDEINQGKFPENKLAVLLKRLQDAVNTEVGQ